MGYRFNNQASLSTFSPYFVLYKQEQVLLLPTKGGAQGMVKMDDSKTWLATCQAWANLFRYIMPMALEKLGIAKQRDMLWYATI